MKAVIWSKYNCPFCDQAKLLLGSKEIQYEERKIGDGWTKEDLLEAVPGARSVPQIFIDNRLVGGYNDLVKELTTSARTAPTENSNAA